MTPAAPITIRPFTEPDLPAYITLRLEALRDHPASFGSSYEDCRDLTPDQWRARTQHFLTGTDSQLFLADAGHELAGLLGLSRQPGSKLRHAADVISVYLRPHYRGEHLLDRLLTPALEWSRAHDIALLRLTVTTANTPALRCYERLGFTTTGTLPQAIRTPDGIFHDEYLMSRPV